MADFQGFWSYVHEDDQVEGGRISRLARDVVAQFEMLTGDKLALFLDRDAIKWGEAWHEKIDSNLASVAFFIPVMTPRYFMRPECRRELQLFARTASRLGLEELVLPLHYVAVPSLLEGTSADDLVALLRRFQWEDWRELRFADVAAEAYRRGVARLAARIVEANRNVERSDSNSVAVRTEVFPTGGADDSPGFLDRVATAEETLPKWTGTIETITVSIGLVGAAVETATAEMRQSDSRGDGFGVRLLVARKLAHQLAEPVERISSCANEFVSQLHEVDDGIRALIERASVEAKQKPESIAAICGFFHAVRNLSTSTHVGLESTQQMIDVLVPVEGIARDLRPVVRRLRQGLATMVEARDVSDEWVGLIDGSGVACDELAELRP